MSQCTICKQLEYTMNCWTLHMYEQQKVIYIACGGVPTIYTPDSVHMHHIISDSYNNIAIFSDHSNFFLAEYYWLADKRV